MTFHFYFASGVLRPQDAVHLLVSSL